MKFRSKIYEENMKFDLSSDIRHLIDEIPDKTVPSTIQFKGRLEKAPTTGWLSYWLCDEGNHLSHKSNQVESSCMGCR